MPARLRLIKSDDPGITYRADARLRLWGAAACIAAAVELTVIGYEGRLPPLLAGPLSAAFLIWAGYLVATFAEQNAQRYTLTSSRLDIERGVFTKRYESVELWRIREVVLEQTLGERMRGAGRVTVLSNDSLRPALAIGPVARVRTFLDLLASAREEKALPATGGKR
ncbi:MAG TPA: PH domain-containing protein [Myxococcales bacterium]|nr:PH domain-containing protein [Myxococcales bacterium]